MDNPDEQLPSPALPTASATAPARRALMNRKPVIYIPSGTIINLQSAFQEKELCDGPTFSTGLACAYKCSFCYVGAMMGRHPTVVEERKRGVAFQDLVIRRDNALEKLERELLTAKGSPRFPDPDDTRVIYSSPLVDVAANVELARETAEACLLILKHTHWQIRLLSKSNLLPVIAAAIPEQYKPRMIFGVSTGTLDDKLATAFELGTPPPSKRIASIRKLQEAGWRTFGMICPSLPHPDDDYDAFSAAMAEALNIDAMEHVWAEVINVRGHSLTHTTEALASAGYPAEAAAVDQVSKDKEAWEAYARETFNAHTRHIHGGKLKYLQYVTADTAPWWARRTAEGAILLGAAVHQA